MISFSEALPDEELVSTLSTHLGWSHFVKLLPLQKPHQRDFAFVARQKRIVVDGDDFYLDLLFYHRSLRRFVIIDLKLGKFAPSDVGQMEFYMRWLKKHEMRPGEEEPLGLIPCAQKSDERIEVF